MSLFDIPLFADFFKTSIHNQMMTIYESRIELYHAFLVLGLGAGGRNTALKTHPASIAPIRGHIQYTYSCSHVLCELLTYAQPNACS
ncbi:hypothetical protein BAE44_0001641 [Dichanthelium oligosanthes]|uniref:Uncharacterized protein n=1 Tax=Dichanthelium oligosanthes TaxID=888268 RepID=A0A1E5WIW0_9POAL|nr:hypothetical protein BAE44_0001641 [Dichanthelium oligosanthes]